MKLPKPLESRKVWIAGMALGALVGLGMSGHADGTIIAGIVAIGGGGVGAQGVLDYKAGGSA